MSLYVALLHYPVVDRNKQIITASVTNLDLHDIARSSRTFGVKKYFVVHPSADEQALNRRIVRHWNAGFGKRANPTRSDALDLVELVESFEDAVTQIEALEGQAPLKIGTSAKNTGAKGVSEAQVAQWKSERPVLLVFGTGYGLAAGWVDRLDYFLPPILGPSDFNHLSVRSAVSIYLDRVAAVRS